jgi:hypothetical protein
MPVVYLLIYAYMSFKYFSEPGTLSFYEQSLKPGRRKALIAVINGLGKFYETSFEALH